jgi:hypothetical protein
MGPDHAPIMDRSKNIATQDYVKVGGPQYSNERRCLVVIRGRSTSQLA